MEQQRKQREVVLFQIGNLCNQYWNPKVTSRSLEIDGFLNLESPVKMDRSIFDGSAVISVSGSMEPVFDGSMNLKGVNSLVAICHAVLSIDVQLFLH